MSAFPRLCSLIPGLSVKLSVTVLARLTVLSAVEACPPHDGVRRRWWINVASAVSSIESSQKIGRPHHRHRPGWGLLFPPRREPRIYVRLRGSLLVRPSELGVVDPHAMQDDRKLTCDGNLGLAKPISLGQSHAPSL